MSVIWLVHAQASGLVKSSSYWQCSGCISGLLAAMTKCCVVRVCPFSCNNILQDVLRRHIVQMCLSISGNPE